jgi:hypothetical protein
MILGLSKKAIMSFGLTEAMNEYNFKEGAFVLLVMRENFPFLKMTG